MPKQVIENENNDVTDSDGEDIQEFKASMGDPSEVPEPVDTKAKKRRGDKDTGDSTLADVEKKVTKDKTPKTKAGMINTMVQSMNGMKKEDLDAIFGDLVGALSEDEIVEEDEVVQESRPLAKITTDDVDISEDLEAMFGSDNDLGEDFKTKAATIFETAVVSKVNDMIAQFTNEIETDAVESSELFAEELGNKVDTYLDYVVSEWIEENRLAIETGVRADMVEDFLRGMKNLFTEHYIDIPEDKVDVVEELVARQTELEAELNEQTDKNVVLSEEVKSFRKNEMISEAAEELTDTQRVKLASLVDGISYSSEDEFHSKVAVIKEQYFNIENDNVDLSEDVIVPDDDAGDNELDEEVQSPKRSGDPQMDAIVAQLSRGAKR